MFLLVIFLPPIAVLMCGRPFQALLNVILTCLGWIPGIIHAWVVYNNKNADKRTDKLIGAMQAMEAKKEARDKANTE